MPPTFCFAYHDHLRQLYSQLSTLNKHAEKTYPPEVKELLASLTDPELKDNPAHLIVTLNQLSLVAATLPDAKLSKALKDTTYALEKEFKLMLKEGKREERIDEKMIRRDKREIAERLRRPIEVFPGMFAGGFDREAT